MNIIFSYTYEELSELLINEFSLINVQIGFELLNDYDLNLYRLESNRNKFGLLVGSSPKIIEALGNIMSVSQFKLVESSYMKILLDASTNNRAFINIENFLFSDDTRRIISRDGRILVYDHLGNVPQDIMLNISSVAVLVLSGICDPVIGYDYINFIMLRYGIAEFTFQMNGYLHIRLGHKPVMQYKASYRADRPKKT